MQKFLKYIRKNNNTYAGRCIKCSQKFYVFTKTLWVSSLLPSPHFYFVNFNYANFWKFFITAIFKGKSEWPILTITFPIISEASVLRFLVTDSDGGITVVTRGYPCAFQCVEIFYFVEMQSVICLYFHSALQFFN